MRRAFAFLVALGWLAFAADFLLRYLHALPLDGLQTAGAVWGAVETAFVCFAQIARG